MKKILKVALITVLALVVLGFVAMLFNGITPIGFGIHEDIYNVDDVALDGFDVAAYFDEGIATKGKPQFSATYDGVTWLFNSQQHLDKFSHSPERFVPACGGHCSYAATTGFAAPGNGEYWVIVNSRLYILSNAEVKAAFELDLEGMALKADEAWK